MVSKVEVKVKLWSEAKIMSSWKTHKTDQINPCTHMVANLVSKQDPKIARNLRISWENWDFPFPKLQFSSHKIRFSSTAFRFPRNPRKSSSMAFHFLQWLSTFFNGFLISSTALWFSSMAFRFLQRLSDFPQQLSTFQEIRENLSMAASIQKIVIRALYPSQNRDK